MLNKLQRMPSEAVVNPIASQTAKLSQTAHSDALMNQPTSTDNAIAKNQQLLTLLKKAKLSKENSKL